MFVSCFKTMYDVKMYEVNHFDIVFDYPRPTLKFETHIFTQFLLDFF